jgi:hypothetical protein
MEIRKFPTVFTQNYYVDGKLSSETIIDDVNTSVALPKWKNSIDSGCFKPGVYRVNPYSVSSGTVNSGTLEFEAYFSYYHRYGAFLEYKNTCKGGILTELVETANGEQTTCNTDNYADLVLQKARSKIGSADLALGETLGEYRQTIKMLKEPLGQLKKFLLDDRGRNMMLLLAMVRKDRRVVNRLLGRTGKASAESLASTWLEIRYGLRPLVYLVQDVIEKVNRQQREFLPDKIRSARSSLSFTETNRRFIDNAQYGTMKFRSWAIVEDRIYAHASVQYRQQAQASFLDQLGLTPRFLPEVLWELTKLSFVVDWLFSIGPWLATLRVNPGVEILGNSVGCRVERSVTLSGTECGTSHSQSPYKEIDNGGVKLTTSTYNREVQQNVSYLPQFTWGRTLDLFKAIDAVSLIWQFANNYKRK